MPPIPRDAPPLRFHIREAKPSDVRCILDLIIDLATYENEPESAKATPELLTTNLFGATPYAHCLLAFPGAPASAYADTTSSTAPDHDPAPVGLALYFFNFSTWTGKPGLYVSTFVLTFLWQSRDAQGKITVGGPQNNGNGQSTC